MHRSAAIASHQRIADVRLCLSIFARLASETFEQPVIRFLSKDLRAELSLRIAPQVFTLAVKKRHSTVSRITSVGTTTPNFSENCVGRA
jgi:hypothetical protein